MASSTSLTLLFFPFLLTLSHALNFDIVNQCSTTVWAAWVVSGTGEVRGGGQLLNQGQSWKVNINPGDASGRIWARTGCSFDANGNGQCQTGDCGKLACTSSGSAPITMAEFFLNTIFPPSPTSLDFFDISLVQGFNVPMDFRSTSASCSLAIQCTADVVGQCPSELKVPGGCDDPCTIFKSDRFCCRAGPAGSGCGPTTYSQFFKSLCPNVYTYPYDDSNTTFTCPVGTNYKVTFCP